MPRWLIGLALGVSAAALILTALLTSDPGADARKPGHYVVELDNAFGLTIGSDVKEGGVRAGKIQSIELDQGTRRALVEIHMTLPGFDSLRRDAFCQVRPQSLIGEYYLDCKPGQGARLPGGGRIPVAQTGSAIGLDLLNTITRKPYNERVRLVVGELGAGVAARGGEINLALRRSLPALRQVNRVLRILAEENRTLAALARDGDHALAGVARRRADVRRFVGEAADTATASARRRAALSEQFRRYPGFLQQLPPAMRSLGRVADAQTGSLRELSAGADRLRTFFNRLGEFSSASVPAVSALGKAARTGRRTARDAPGPLGELARASERVPELSKNAAIILEHLDDRGWAIEPDKRSPEGKGYTGLEAPLMYVFNQAMAVNIFNAGNHILKVNLLNSRDCAPYADAERAREHPECSAATGPVQPGINAPDPTAESKPAARRHRAHRRKHRRGRRHVSAAAPAPSAAPAAPEAAPAAPAPVAADRPALLPPLPQLPQVPEPQLRDASAVLDYLLGS